MGLWESALILLGIGILSEKMGAGTGLTSLGTGIQTLIAAPLTGTGTGLSSLALGLRDVFETFGDLGRGISAVFGALPKWALPGYVGPGGSGSGKLPTGNGNGLPPLIAMSGGDDAALLPGGGGNVPLPNGIWTPFLLSESWLSTFAPDPAAYSRYSIRQENDLWRYAPLVG